MQANTTQPVLKGYLYILIETFTVPSAEGNVSCHLSLGQIAKCNTAAVPSGTAINEVFLIEVPEDPSRLVMELWEKETVVGDCRYDVNPFFNHPGAAHTISSDIINNSSEVKGTINTKITYYSAQFGKLKLRVFHLELTPAFAERFKTAKLKLKSGIFAQSSPDWDMSKEFDHDYDLLVLQKNANLEFDVINAEGTLAKYTIYDIEKSGLLLEKTKAYQVSLFNQEKAVGTIKYQVDWVHP
jgi:hypothetical protein